MEKNAAVLMADLTGYTAMTDVHGGASAALLVNKYTEFVNMRFAEIHKLSSVWVTKSYFWQKIRPMQLKLHINSIHWS